jgi:hypothetical protein
MVINLKTAKAMGLNIPEPLYYAPIACRMTVFGTKQTLPIAVMNVCFWRYAILERQVSF